MVALKLPVFWLCWYIYKVIQDVPDQVVGEDNGGQPVSVVYADGPRKRGPHGSPRLSERSARRGDKGHDESTEKVHSRPTEAAQS